MSDARVQGYIALAALAERANRYLASRIVEGRCTTHGTCTVCGEYLPVAAFYADPSKPLGRTSHCRVCFQDRLKARRSAQAALRRPRERKPRKSRAADPSAPKTAGRSRNRGGAGPKVNPRPVPLPTISMDEERARMKQAEADRAARLAQELSERRANAAAIEEANRLRRERERITCSPENLARLGAIFSTKSEADARACFLSCEMSVGRLAPDLASVNVEKARGHSPERLYALDARESLRWQLAHPTPTRASHSGGKI
jgi:hypothetical protein